MPNRVKPPVTRQPLRSIAAGQPLKPPAWCGFVRQYIGGDVRAGWKAASSASRWLRSDAKGIK
jgi:hypothetical protein